MAETPILSVIVPVYNAEKSLERCLNSIKKQTYVSYEVILIDDGSKDKSGELCDRYVMEDDRFKVIHTENRGVSSARNNGLQYANGKYVMFIDSDDSIHSDYFETYINYMEREKCDVVIGGLIRKEGNQVDIKNVVPMGTMRDGIWEFICRNPEMYGYMHGKIYKLEIIKNEYIRFNEKMYAQEDFDFNLSVYEKSAKFVMINYAGYEYEYTPGKRRPPVWDFISNSLKAYGIGCRKSDLSMDAKEVVCNSIVSQIFTFLYNCGNINEYEFALEKLKGVIGLGDFLNQQSLSGEKKAVINWFLDEKYERMYKYFKARKTVKKLLGRPIAE